MVEKSRCDMHRDFPPKWYFTLLYAHWRKKQLFDKWYLKLDRKRDSSSTLYPQNYPYGEIIVRYLWFSNFTIAKDSIVMPYFDIQRRMNHIIDYQENSNEGMALWWTFPKAEKSWTRPGQRLMATRQLSFSGLPWHFHSRLNFFQREILYQSFAAMYQSFDHGRCHVSKVSGNVSKLWYMARISVYFISRIPWKKIRTGNPSKQERKCHGQPGKIYFLI